MTSAALVPFVRKEVRALLPLWLASLLAAGAASISHDYGLLLTGLVVCAAGGLALGSFSIGHEYSYRTLGALIVQPANRHWLWASKLVVAALMVAPLALIAWRISGILRVPAVGAWGHGATAFVGALFALFVAPVITMLCRNPLAGVVLTAALPGVLLMAGDLLGLALFGVDRGRDIDQLKMALFNWGLPAFAIVASVAGWFLFSGLEAIDGRDQDFHLPRRQNVAGVAVTEIRARRYHPWRALIAKELRLQQMTAVVVGLYVLGWLGIAVLEAAVESPRQPMSQITLFYMSLVAILIGSLACAEERQLGTHDAQLCQPISPVTQWMLKVGVAIALAIVVGVGLPLLLQSIHHVGEVTLLPNRAVSPYRDWVLMALSMVALTSVSLFVSSSSASGVWAMVISLPVVILLMTSLRFITVMAWRSWAAMKPAALAPYRLLEAWPYVVIVAGIMLLLWLGLYNYRTAERRRSRLAWQSLAIAGYVVMMFVITSTLRLLAFS